MKRVDLGVFGTAILHPEDGRPTLESRFYSIMVEEQYPAVLKSSLSAIMAACLAHYSLDLVVDDQRYKKGLESTVDAMMIRGQKFVRELSLQPRTDNADVMSGEGLQESETVTQEWVENGLALLQAMHEEAGVNVHTIRYATGIEIASRASTPKPKLSLVSSVSQGQEM